MPVSFEVRQPPNRRARRAAKIAKAIPGNRPGAAKDLLCDERQRIEVVAYGRGIGAAEITEVIRGRKISVAHDQVCAKGLLPTISENQAPSGSWLSRL